MTKVGAAAPGELVMVRVQRRYKWVHGTNGMNTQLTVRTVHDTNSAWYEYASLMF